MRVTALFLCLAVVTASCADLTRKTDNSASSSDAQIAPSQRLSIAQPCQDPNSEDEFISRVKLLKVGGFDWSNNGLDQNGVYAAPIEDADQSGKDVYVPALRAAFQISPSQFRKEICNSVDAVYVDQDNQSPLGWSYWEEEGQGSGKRRFIAVGKNLWSKYKKDLGSIETIVGRYILSPGNVSAPKNVYAVRAIVDSGAPPNAQAILAVLAREMGFIIQHRLFELSLNTQLSCDSAIQQGSSFYDISWRPFKPLPEKGGIHQIGDRATFTTRKSVGTPSLESIRNDLNAGGAANEADARKKLYSIYKPNSGKLEWIDFYASLSPTEDFVETYRMIILSDPASLLSLVVDFNPGTQLGPTTNIIDNLKYSNYRLAEKQKCMQNLRNRLS